MREATLGEALLTPTRLYVSLLLPLIRQKLLKGLAHITGGGLLDNLPRVLPPALDAVIDIASSGWTLPPVFRWLQTIAQLPQNELLRTFNCGVGMVLVIGDDCLTEVLQSLRDSGEDILVLGQLVPATDQCQKQSGIRIIGDLI